MSSAVPEVKPSKLEIRLKKEVVVDTAAVKKLSGLGSNSALLDSRPLEEFTGERLSEDVPKAGHIPGAMPLYWMENLVSRENPVLKPVEELRSIYQRAGVSPGGRVLTYCRTGMQSSFDYFVAKYLGYEANMYDASFFEWSREKLPVEKGNP